MTDRQEQNGKSPQAYNTMLERVRHALDEAGDEALPTLHRQVEKAREVAEELGELTRDESEKVAAYLKRDLQDAGHYLSETGRELGDWFRFDMSLIEDRLLELITRVADRTDLEWLQLEEQFRESIEYHSGEITGPGTLICKSCDKAIHFHHTAHIPPCPHCHSGQFRRPHLDEAVDEQ